MRGPRKGEDARNLSLIIGSGVLAALLTAGLLTGSAAVRDEVIRPVAVAPAAPTTSLSARNQLYGRVVTDRGREFTGFIRWDRNEGSWSDLLDADKADEGRVTTSGIRFGHIDRIEVLDGRSALFTLRSGEHIELQGGATDLGRGLRALVVHDPDVGTAELRWDDLRAVEFMETPEGVPVRGERLYGTLTTRAGLSFTGHVTWDVDEVYTSDILDGDVDGEDTDVRFGDIEVIEHYGSGASRVVLRSGDVLVMDGSNDVNSSNGGISVSDPDLGQVKVDWDEFEDVRFHAPHRESGFSDFDGGRELRGTVVTEDGRRFSGTIVWDDDETRSWEMLNGKHRDIEFQIEFSNIERVVKTGRSGATVVLRDGRSFDLSDSNDVDSGNRGITVRSGSADIQVEWDDFAELRLER